MVQQNRIPKSFRPLLGMKTSKAVAHNRMFARQELEPVRG